MVVSRVLLDVDVLLDVLLEREPFVENASELLQLIESEQIEGYVIPITLSKIFDISREKESVEIAWQAVSTISTMLKICSIDYRTLEKASSFKVKDFEAGLQLACATILECQAIITRREKEFTSYFLQDFQDITESNLAILSPGKFLEFSQNKVSSQGLSSYFRYLRESNERLYIVDRIINSASSIVVNSTNVLVIEETQLIEEGEMPTNSKIIVCQQYPSSVILRIKQVTKKLNYPEE